MDSDAAIVNNLRAITNELRLLNKNLAKIEAEIRDAKLVLNEKLPSDDKRGPFKEEEYRRV